MKMGNLASFCFIIFGIMYGYDFQGTGQICTSSESTCVSEEIRALRLEMAAVNARLALLTGIAVETEERNINWRNDLRTEIDDINAKLADISDNTYIHANRDWRKRWEITLLASKPHYQHTFNEGKVLCETSGGTLPTYQQLEVAFRSGLDLCACGWLSDGVAYYPSQFPRVGCGGPTGQPRVVQCPVATEWDTWCLYEK